MNDDMQNAPLFMDSGNPAVSIVEIAGETNYIAHSAIGILGSTFSSERLADDAVYAIGQAFDAQGSFRAREVAAEHCFAEELLAREMSETTSEHWEMLSLESKDKQGNTRTAFILIDAKTSRIHAVGFLLMEDAARTLDTFTGAAPSGIMRNGG